ncbi:MAG: hypothetical protein KA775_02825 [Ottowia sp.]|nr:hypothetical protein [Ottowia sp.]MBP7530742.1 hypothetical protein [Ottowia sp.]MBP7538103.1 hypothetical protein [Ottowia sp.]HRL37339.1 hypothetical protein [Ottowia beijingensis]
MSTMQSLDFFLMIKDSPMTCGTHPLCGSGLARDEAPRRNERLIAGKPAPTTLSETGCESSIFDSCLRPVQAEFRLKSI